VRICSRTSVAADDRLRSNTQPDPIKNHPHPIIPHLQSLRTAAQQSSQTTRVALRAVVANAAQYYDSVSFALMGAQIGAAVMPPQTLPMQQLLVVFVLFAAGGLMQLVLGWGASSLCSPRAGTVGYSKKHQCTKVSNPPVAVTDQSKQAMSSAQLERSCALSSPGAATGAQPSSQPRRSPLSRLH